MLIDSPTVNLLFHVDFEITFGEVHDCKFVSEFIERLPSAEHTIADKGYDGEEVLGIIRKKSTTLVIPGKFNSKIGNVDMDWCLY